MTIAKQLKPLSPRKGQPLFVLMTLCSVFIIAQTKYIFAQTKYTISGVVKDAANGETLLGSTVLLKGKIIGSTTNEYGFYSITAPEGNYTLIVSYLGFTTFERTLNLNSNQNLNIEIKEDASKLDEVVIRANAEEPEKVALLTPQMSVTKLTTSDIKQIPVVLG